MIDLVFEQFIEIVNKLEKYLRKQPERYFVAGYYEKENASLCSFWFYDTKYSYNREIKYTSYCKLHEQGISNGDFLNIIINELEGRN